MTKHRVMGLLLALTIILSGAGPSIGKEAGDFMIRLRGIGMIPQESGTTDAIGGNASLDNDFAPEVDFTYFLTDNIAFELIAAITKHDAAVKNTTLGRDVALGDVRVLPPTLTLQYHFFTKEKISPYLGAGINYSVFFDDDIGNDPAVNKVDYTNGFGAAIQAGIDWQFHKNWSLNFDVKKIWIDTDISVNRGAINARDAEVNPLVIGFGIGYRFNTGWSK